MRNVMERPNPSQAVLVGGAWGAVEDWQWVRAELALRQIVATVVDLPSLRSGDATRGDDVAAVRTVMDSIDAAVILVGWSYGGALISDAAFGVPGVARLVYVAAIPESAGAGAGDVPPFPAPDLSHVRFPDDRTCVLDDDWWLTDGPGASLPTEVVGQLREHRRRPMSLAALTGSQRHDAWRSVPTTVVLGADDELNPPECQRWAVERFGDVRILPGDHFLLFRSPAAIAAVIGESR